MTGRSTELGTGRATSRQLSAHGDPRMDETARVGLTPFTSQSRFHVNLNMQSVTEPRV